jgi:DNA-binding transcriptional LysR family regulator
VFCITALFIILQIRAFLCVIEEGSLHRAATRLSLSQSALSRQMQALEHNVGGKLLERSSTGVQPTSGGHALAAKMRPCLASYDAAMLEVRRLVCGASKRLRIGYVGSAALDYLNPALAELRQAYPAVKLQLHDLSPGEQISALRHGKIDVGLMDQAGDLLALDFSTRRVAAAPSLVFLPADHSLASRKRVRLAELKGEAFVSGLGGDMPGFNHRVTQLCRKLGKFRAKFIGQPQSLAEGLELVANDHAVLLLPEFVRHRAGPGVSPIPIADATATWNLDVVWQRGKVVEPLSALLNALSSSARRQSHKRKTKLV